MDDRRSTGRSYGNKKWSSTRSSPEEITGFREGKPVYAKAGEKYKKDDKPAYGKSGGTYKKDAPTYQRSKKSVHDKAESAQTGAAETQSAPVREDELPYLVMGRNAVREAIKSGRSIDRLLVSSELDGSLREIVNLARDNGVQVRQVERAKLDELCMPFGHGEKTGNHQGIVAQVPGVQYCELTDILNAAKAKGEPPFVILLDGIEDPYNLGSIIRSAECAGAHGVVIPNRRAASVTSSACKASAGAVEYMKIARVSNLSGAIQRLKDEGLFIAGADMTGSPMASCRLDGAIGLVIGNEGSGISRLIKQNCDMLAAIPMGGSIGSLNASVAAAILMFEKRRQDGK